MTNQKMLRFLSSIHIDNVDDFDLSFEMINKNRFNPNQWDMVIVKEKVWEYRLLKQFIDSLSYITYKYTLRFSYLKRPDFADVNRLFDEWHLSIYHIPSTILLEDTKNDVIIFHYPENDKKEMCLQIIKDFKDFLKFINYEFVVRTQPIKTDDEVKISSRKLKKIEKEAEKEAFEDISEMADEPPINDSSDVQEMIKQEEEDMTTVVEDSLIELMQNNLVQMKKERERARLNKRGNYTPIANIDSITKNSDHVDFDAQVFSTETREFGGRARFTIGLYDKEGGAIFLNMYETKLVDKKFVDSLKFGTYLRVRGVAYFDEFNKSVVIKGHFLDLLPPPEIVADEEGKTRVELHLHTNMSNMDAVTKMDAYAAYAKSLGHKAIAITDHAAVQGYPDAQKAADKHKIKMLYGCELYMIDDRLEYVKNPLNIPLNKANYVIFDLETTGLSCRYNRIIEFGAVKVENGVITKQIDILINPEIHIPEKITSITSITDEMVENQPTIKEVMPQILDFIGDAILVSHNASFDVSYLQENLKNLGYPQLTNGIVDTLALSRYLFPDSRRHSLGALCRNMEVFYDEESAHRADYDASVLNEVWQAMLVLLTKKNHQLTHADLDKLDTPLVLLKHMRPKHVIALAKNLDGLKDLYKIVSLSNVEYLAEVPKVPKHEIEKHRKNLIIGSACFNGEVFDNAMHYSEETLEETMSFYDYIEIQPLENYSFLVNMGDLTQDELLQIVQDIVKAADKKGKMICATGDVHYLTKQEKIFRDVYIDSQGIGGVNHPLKPYKRNDLPRFENPDQHYRSTKEMLDCMSFLGEEKAYEITVTNTNIIADSIEEMIPIPNNHLYTPKIENVDQILTDLVFGNAKKLYGDPLPEFIKKRLETELNGIITNKFSVIYYLAYKIVNKTHEDGYIVGSRGSVGSSLVATMAGITEVNPLPPHYVCPHCHHLEWTSESMPNFKSGYDLPDKVCPNCGEKMIHDGQNIPFETFLGFHAEKTPDIDLNFPSDYQARAHDYTKVLVGENNVFRAGTIETVADKTAFGYARGFIERQGINPDTYSKSKIAYLAAGCVDVKRTTGQHPGGIVVIPNDHEVYDFTPIQYPADDKEATWKTTHFDYKCIHDTVLKLDMLGHVDPLALKMMCDLTHINVNDIPLNDEKVLSLFSSPEALNIHKDYLNSKTGALGIPEFGTEFVRGVLEEAKPKTFADLVIISGLSHGTNVWQDNAESLIKSGTATLREVIGCRDDIMTYLIDKKLPAPVSFAIMEDVRKGRGLKPEYVEIMKANKVPQFYIDSCNKIKYMFPKGHAVAYVTMGIRVGYFKVYYPLEFYATFFSCRSKQYDIEAMIKGEDAIISRLEELKIKSKSKIEKLSPKETEQIKTLNIAIEMVQRGYKFSNIDLYKSDAINFVVDHENKSLIPPFITIDGLGENNAVTVIDARNERRFTSKEDLLRRTKLSSTNVNDLAKLGVLKNLDETDQLSLFDF